MYRKHNFKKIIVLIVCVVLFVGGTAEAARPGNVSEKQEQREAAALLNLTRFGINPGIRHLLTGEETADLRNEKAHIKMKNEETRHSDEDIELLARLVHAEAKGESYNGKVAVAATVLNRVRSNSYPGTIRGVIYQYNFGYQYCPVRNGQINRPADEESRKAVREALRGKDPSRGALSFYNPAKSYNRWIRSRPHAVTIGNHIFVK